MHAKKNKRLPALVAYRALTHVEVLATVAALALLLTILVPALNAATGDHRNDMCLSNLRQLGLAVSLYADQHVGTLPGPVSPALYRGVAATAWIEPYRRRYLPYLLQDVLGAGFTDRLVSCPVAAGVNPDRNFELIYYPTGRIVLPTHYALNNWGPWDSSGSPPSPGQGIRFTNPPFYFGFAALLGPTPTVPELEAQYPPQRCGAVANPAREWMIADAWYRNRNNPFPELQQEGPYQAAWTGEALPHFAPHNARVETYQYSSTRSTEAAQMRAARLDGETNTLYFDGHAAAAPSRTLRISDFELLYGFRGTVNPYATPPAMTMAVWR